MCLQWALHNPEIPIDSRHSPASHKEKPAADAVENRMKIAVRDIGIPPRPTILAQIEQETAKDNPDFILPGQVAQP